MVRYADKRNVPKVATPTASAVFAAGIRQYSVGSASGRKGRRPYQHPPEGSDVRKFPAGGKK